MCPICFATYDVEGSIIAARIMFSGNSFPNERST